MVYRDVLDQAHFKLYLQMQKKRFNECYKSSKRFRLSVNLLYSKPTRMFKKAKDVYYLASEQSWPETKRILEHMRDNGIPYLEELEVWYILNQLLCYVE